MNQLKKNGPEQVWVEAMLAEFQPRLIRYARRLLADDEGLAADVVQHAFMKLVEKGRGEINGSVGPWLYSVCRNRAVDELRQRGRERQLADESEETMSAFAIDVKASASAQDELEVLQRLIGRLPVGQREAVELWSSGLSYREIAEVTKKSEVSIRVLVHRGLERIRSHPAVIELMK